jgi:hypothetical protein
MAIGIVEYNSEGHPKCEICGQYFKRVLSHVRQKHEINEREYKMAFGFDLNKGICSKESSAISRKRVYENYDKCIKRNLEDKGERSRFKKGNKGRTKEQVSAQTKIMLKEKLEEPKMKAAMKLSGTKVGLSGTGNKVRWSKNK